MLMCQGVWLRPSLGGLALPLAAALLASSSWAQAPAANLLVSWRVSAQAEQRQVAAQVAQGLTVQTGRRQHDQVQSVMVLNGGQARVFMGRSVPVNTWQLAWQGGVDALINADPLPERRRYLAWGRRVMREAGLEDCRYHNLSGGIVALHKGFRY